MSKRNFILLIIVLVIAVAVVFGFLYFNRTPSPTDNGEGTNFGSQFNPFGTGTTTNPPATTPPTDISGYQPNPEPGVALKLRQISTMPIAGFTVYQKERFKEVPVVPPVDTTTTPETTPAPAKTTKPIPPPTEFAPSLRYVDRATGNIYQTFADKILEKKFSATVIPKIYEAFFGNRGESVVLRYLKGDGKTIESFVGNLAKEVLGVEPTGESEVKGTFLPEDITDMSVSSDAGNIFYLFNVGDNLVGTTLNLSTNKKAQIFSSAFTEWLSFWPNSKMITLTTKPASGIPGYLYVLDTNTKNFTKLIGNVNGLTGEASPDGKLVLYGDDTLSLNLYHKDTNTVDSMGVKTLPEKCVWGKASDAVYCAVPKTIGGFQYPDAWYQGEVSFSDQIWKIDIKTGNTTMIIDPSTALGGRDIDGTKLMLDEGENYLFFVNKKDSILWELGLK